MASGILEGASEDAIIQAAQAMGYRAHAQRPGRRSDGEHRTMVKGDPGFPDLVIVGHGHLFIYELKRRSGHYRPGQKEWLAALEDVGTPLVHSGTLWVPDQQDAFIARLKQISGFRERVG